MKTQLKFRAIELRRKGYTYNEILSEIPVARSTLSLWLRSTKLAKEQEQRITLKRILSAQRGADQRRRERLNQIARFKKQGLRDIGSITKRELWLIGTALYWAEGSKEKLERSSKTVIFSNSDPRMICLVLKWFSKVLDIESKNIYFNIYIHESYLHRIEKVKQFWSDQTGYPISKFDKIYLKKGNTRTKRYNTGNRYFGIVRIKIRKSTAVNRRIAGWIEGIATHCGMV